MIDPRPEARIEDKVLMRLLKWECDCCEITEEDPPLHLHHVIFRGAGRGDDVRANIICITRNLHLRYHAGDPEARLTVAEHIRDKRPDTCLYIADKLSIAQRRPGQEALDDWFSKHNLNRKES